MWMQRYTYITKLTNVYKLLTFSLQFGRHILPPSDHFQYHIVFEIPCSLVLLITTLKKYFVMTMKPKPMVKLW